MTARIKSIFCLLMTSVFLAAPISAMPVEISKKNDQKGKVVRISRPAAAGDRKSNDNGLTTVSLAGRVVTPNGRPIRNAKIILMDIDGPTQITISGGLGYYSITGIIPGRTYVLGVFHKRYIFASPTQTLEINTDQNNVILLGEENW